MNIDEPVLGPRRAREFLALYSGAQNRIIYVHIITTLQPYAITDAHRHPPSRSTPHPNSMPSTPDTSHTKHFLAHDNEKFPSRMLAEPGPIMVGVEECVVDRQNHCTPDTGGLAAETGTECISQVRGKNTSGGSQVATWKTAKHWTLIGRLILRLCLR